MTTLEEKTLIHAPIERCFDLERSIDLHMKTTKRTGERAIAGVTTGLIDLDEEVTWSARHLGVTQTMTVRITAMNRPRYFRDKMVRGAFRFFEHEHVFADRGDGVTEMNDSLRFAAPPPLLGRVIEPLLGRYLRKFLCERNQILKEVAESDEWRNYLPNA